jgi:LCP family protein required for cell wall assembly
MGAFRHHQREISDENGSNENYGNGGSGIVIRNIIHGSIRNKILIVAASLIVLLVAAFFVVKAVQRSQIAKQAVQENQDILNRLPQDALKTIEWNGTSYKPKSNLFSVLLLGIDKTQEMMDAAEGFRNRGQSDFIMLVVIDREAKKISRLMLDRDTITEITTLGTFGNVSGTRSERLSLSFSFGDGGDLSARFTVDAVKRILPKLPADTSDDTIARNYPQISIDAYVAMNLDAIINLNDVVGGVTLEVAGDYSAVNPDWEPGTIVTLHGKEAEQYVRTRANVDSGTNEDRMQRQKSFINALYVEVKEKISQDLTFVDTMFDAVQGNLITNMTRGRMINELNWAQDYEIQPLESLSGEHKVDSKGFMEFHLDEESSLIWVLNTYYSEIAN